MRFKALSLAATLAAAAASVQAAPVIQTGAIAVSDSGAPSTFGFSFGIPIAIAGATNVTISLIGAYGDGARDGAAVTPIAPGALISTSLGAGPVASTGGSASFVGAGGTGGMVTLNGVAVSDFGAPSTFGFLFALPIGTLTAPTLSQGAVAGGLIDFGSDGAVLNGQYPGGGIAQFRVNSAGTPVGSYFVGTSPVDDAAPFIGLGSAQVPCSAAAASCDSMDTGLSFTLSGGGDALAMLARHEVGGDPLSGDVLATYGIQAGSGAFDCATIVGGCTFLTTTLSFTLSGGGDAAAFAFRVVVDSASVPEPGTLALLGFGLAGLLAARRRNG